MIVEEVPVWLVLLVWCLFGTWLLGRYEGWWARMAARRAEKKAQKR